MSFAAKPRAIQSCKLQLCLPSGRIGCLDRCRAITVPKRQTRIRRIMQTRAADDRDDGSERSWDLGRFVRTIRYFNEPPTPREILSAIIRQPQRVFNALTGSGVEGKKSVVLTMFGSTATASGGVGMGVGGPRPPVILVAGASGGVGKRVVEALLRRGKRVRALVRDADKGTQLLAGLRGAPGSALELVAADITQAATLLPEMFVDVRGLVIASAVKVAPKEGDTVDRAKYLQGIKFYDPEIVGDTPETVELVGVRNLVLAAREHLGLQEGKVIFAPTGEGVSKAWGALDDVVMGGRSESGFEVRSGVGEDGGQGGMFSGLVRFDRGGGGFASVRTKNFEPKLDLGAYQGLHLRLKGDGLRYKCIIRTDSNWDGIGFCKSFDTVEGQWQTVSLPFSDFMPVFRARTLKDGTGLDASQVSSVQLMLSKFEYDGDLNPAFRSGPFSLPVGYIRAMLPEPLTPRLVHISSAGVTRPNRPGIDVNVEPPAVRMNDALGGILTFKLKGEDTVRTSGVPFAVVRPVALTEEPGGAELQLDQGDTIKGKISREDIAELCAELLESPVAADTTFEIKSTVPFSQPYEADPSQPPRDWQALLQSAELQKSVTGKTIDGRYTGKEPEPHRVGVPSH